VVAIAQIRPHFYFDCKITKKAETPKEKRKKLSQAPQPT